MIKNRLEINYKNVVEWDDFRLNGKKFGWASNRKKIVHSRKSKKKKTLKNVMDFRPVLTRAKKWKKKKTTLLNLFTVVRLFIIFSAFFLSHLRVCFSPNFIFYFNVSLQKLHLYEGDMTNTLHLHINTHFKFGDEKNRKKELNENGKKCACVHYMAHRERKKNFPLK